MVDMLDREKMLNVSSSYKQHIMSEYREYLVDRGYSSIRIEEALSDTIQFELFLEKYSICA